MAAHPNLLVQFKEGAWESYEVPTPLKHYRRPLVIAGSHPNGREHIPWDDERYEIWTFNEAPMKPWCKRWDVNFQLHRPEVYTSPDNFVEKDHWSWLQERRGKPIYMYPADPRVPDAVEYPLDEVLKLIPNSLEYLIDGQWVDRPYRYLRSTPAQALAVAILLGYTDITLYGSELTSNTEYAYQAQNMAFWIGYINGRNDITFHLRCWQDEFAQRIYGIEGDVQVEAQYFLDRIAEIEPIAAAAERAYLKARGKLDAAMTKAEFMAVGELLAECDQLAQSYGEGSAILGEARKYGERTTHTPRQEFERTSAQAQMDGLKLRDRQIHTGGIVEYLWNAWLHSGSIAALSQLREKSKEQFELAVQVGQKAGVMKENMTYMVEYDDRAKMAGGKRALHAAGIDEPG